MNDRGLQSPEWMENDLDAALREAGRRKTPALVWWTAKWCPPCNELFCAIFSAPCFAERAERLVLAKLDGDAAGAQAIGDRLAVTSYPSPLLLDPDGTERLRFPGGLKAPEFCGVMDLVIAHPRRIGELVGLVDCGGDLSSRDVSLLAYHWWSIDPKHAAGAARVPFLLRVLERIPAAMPEASRRLLPQILWAAARGDTGVDAPSLAERSDLSAALLAQLRHGPSYSEAYPLLVDPSILGALAAAGTAARRELDAALRSAAEGIIATQDPTHTERLIALSAILALGKVLEGPAAIERLVPRVREAVRTANETSATFPERQTAINMAGHLLKAAGLREEAAALFRHEAEHSPEGSYFMSYLADIAFEKGDAVEGLAWLRKAWESTPPGSSRFSRGVRFVSRAVERGLATPDPIESLVTRLLAESEPGDLGSGRNRANLEALVSALRKRG